MAVTREEVLGRIGRRPAGKDGSAIMERLGRGRDLRHRMTWPGGTMELELQVLTRGETASALAAALVACAARGISESATSPRSIEARVDEELTQILAIAIREPETHERVFKSADELAAVATDDELVTLFGAYSDHRHAVDPDPEEMPAEDFAALEDAIKKKDERLLSDIVFGMPRPWLRTSALRLATSLMGSSTSTSGSSASPSPPPAPVE